MTALNVAIVGSGPSGFFAAELLLKSDSAVVVHMFERLPTPYGLVRSGVAPDHQQIKQVVRIFDKIARNPAFSFFGNVEVGKDVELTTLRSRYDAVILAYGASDGTLIDIPGSTLPQSITATTFVNWYNGHPDYRDFSPCLEHETAVIIGHGNVAIDVTRILLSDHDRLSKTDIADHALDALRHSKVRKVHLVGRRGPLQASFTTAELRELLLGMSNVATKVDARLLDFEPAELAFMEQPVNAALKRNVLIMQEAASRTSDAGCERELRLVFLASPTAIHGSTHVTSVEFVQNCLAGPVDGRTVRATEETYDVSAGLVVSSIGFRGRPMEGLPFDENRGVCRHAAGRIIDTGTDGIAPLYAAGWIKRGASGVIGTNRADAAETVQTLIADRLARVTPRSPMSALNLQSIPVDFEGWDRIDSVERAAGLPTGRPRRKIVDTKTMLTIATGG